MTIFVYNLLLKSFYVNIFEYTPMSILTQPFTESLQKLLSKTCNGSDEEQCTAAQNQLKCILETLPANVVPIFEWLINTLDDTTIEQNTRIQVLRTLSMVVNITPTLAPKALGKLSEITNDAQCPQTVCHAAHQTLNIVKRAMPSAVSWSGGYKSWEIYVHCPLCHCPTLYPEIDAKKPAFIFLDMDGVIMPENRYYHEIDSQLRELFPHVEHHTYHPYTKTQELLVRARFLDKDALEGLHQIIDSVEASGQRPLIVITSAWRHPTLVEQQREEIYAQYKFGQYICGKTPPEDRFHDDGAVEYKLGFDFYENAQKHYQISLKSIGDAIEFWLRDHHFDLDTTNFVVINAYLHDSLSRFGSKLVSTGYLLRNGDVQRVIDVLGGKQANSQDKAQ